MNTLWIADGAREALAELGIATVSDGWRGDLPGEIINDRGDRQVLRLRAPSYARHLYLKRWRCSLQSPLRFLPISRRLRMRARVERENLELLAKAGIAAPLPLAFGEEMGMCGPVASILILEGLDEYCCSADWIVSHPGDRRQVAVGIAKILASLHNRGLYYRSPGLKHFFVHLEGAGRGMALIDVPRLDRSLKGPAVFLSQLLHLDAPSPERDLSKAWLTLMGELGADEQTLAAFWDAYCESSQSNRDPKLLRDQVEPAAVRRLGGRARRAQRKGEPPTGLP
jgi:hypothetical protein